MAEITFELVLTKEQRKQVATLGKEIWNEHYGELLGAKQIEYMLKKFQSEEALEEQEKHGYQYYLICIEGVPEGYIGIQPQGQRLFLSKLYLRKQQRGQGIARKALEMMTNICHEKGLNAIYLTVNKQNDSKLVYDALGFKVISEEVTDIGQGFVMDDYIMEIPIK